MTEEQIFMEAIGISDATERRAFIKSACGQQESLCRRINALMNAHQASGDFLETPATKTNVSTSYESSLEPGTLIDRYRIVRVLGEGGMGAVYLAEQVEPVQRQVALKLIRPGLSSSHILNRFETERQTLAIMDHPNIAKVFDAGTTDAGQPYFVMELVAGSPITEYCTTHGIGLHQRLNLFIAVCQAVQHAHQKGILHRDLKPTNILIVEYDSKPAPKIIDFGVAKALEQSHAGQPDSSFSGLLVGTLEYMSPEQADLNPLDVDSRSDVYTLGVLLYELLTATTPLRQGSPLSGEAAEMLRAIRETEPRIPSAQLAENRHSHVILHKHVLGELDWIVMKALEKDRNYRYDTAVSLGMDVQRYLDNEPVLAAGSSSRYRLRKFISRHRTVISIVMSALLALVALSIYSVWLAWRATQAEEQARLESWHAGIQRDRAFQAEVDASLQRDKAVTAEKQAVAEMQRANEEAAGAKAALDYLMVDLLMETDPQKNPREKMFTSEELLGRAASRLAGKFGQQPKIEATIRQVIGVMYRKLGNYAAAQQHLERALQLRLTHLGEEHEHTLNTMDALAVVYDAQRKGKQAEKMMQRAYETAVRRLGKDNPLTVVIMANLGVLLLQAGKLEQAEPFLLASFQWNRSRTGENNLSTLSSMHNLAVLYLEQGKLKESEELLARTLLARQKLHGSEHPRVITSMQMLGSVYQCQMRYDTANEQYEQALAISRKVLGRNHPTTQNIMRCQASNHEAQGNYTLSESQYREILSMSQSDQTDIMYCLVHNLLHQKKYVQAEELIRRKAGVSKESDPTAWMIDYQHLLFGMALLGQNKSSEARSHLQTGCQGIQQSLEQAPRRARHQVLSILTMVCKHPNSTDVKNEQVKCREAMNWLQSKLQRSDN